MNSKRQSEQLLHASGSLNGPALAGSHILRRILAIALVVATTTVFPRTSQAEFMSAAAQRGPSGLLSTASIDAAAAPLDVSWGLFGWGTSSDQREPVPAEKPPVEENHRPLDVPGASDLGGNSSGMGTSSTPSGGATGGCVGILNGSLTPLLTVCAGSALCRKVLVPPSPPSSSLLDPPKDVACRPAGLPCR